MKLSDLSQVIKLAEKTQELRRLLDAPQLYKIVLMSNSGDENVLNKYFLNCEMQQKVFSMIKEEKARLIQELEQLEVKYDVEPF